MSDIELKNNSERGFAHGLPSADIGTGSNPSAFRSSGNARAVRQPFNSFSLIKKTAKSISERVLSANHLRSYLMIQNNGTTAIYINFGSNADSGCFKISGNGGYYELNFACAGNELFIMGSSGGEKCVIIEGAFFE